MSPSYPPPPPLTQRAPLRPRFLVVAMIITWFVGVQGLTTGLHIITYLRHGAIPSADAAEDRSSERARDIARLQTLVEIHEVAFPLAVGEVLLSGLLVVASGLAMGGRRGARSLALQAIAAHLAFAAVDYALTQPVRAAGIEAFAHAAAQLGGDDRPTLDAWWLSRVRFFAFHGLTMGFGAYALTRERTKAFFAAVARATERAEEEP